MSIVVPLEGFGGGAALNFKVVGGTSRPANPRENTIWINTSTTITDWVFSATQPEAVAGRVWIFVGTSSTVEFNALKKNCINVYPVSVKQHVSGTWVDKTAESYQNGAWANWSYIIKNLNVEHWKANGTTARANVSNVDEGLQISFTSVSTWQDVGGYVDEGVDLTNYKTVVFQGTHTGKAERVQLCIYKKDASIVASVDLATGSNEQAVVNKLENYPINCEELTGTFYFGIKATVGAYVGSIIINKISAK